MNSVYLLESPGPPGGSLGINEFNEFNEFSEFNGIISEPWALRPDQALTNLMHVMNFFWGPGPREARPGSNEFKN